MSWPTGGRAEDSRAGIVLDGVPEHERTMPLELVFWSHFSPNVSLSGWIVGIVMVQIGLDLPTALVVTVIGGIAGGIPTALAAAMGPSTGHTQIENSRYAFGRLGVRIPAVLTWAGSVGWNAVNNIPAAIALLALLALVHLRAPMWAGLALLAVVQGYAAHRGHHLVQAVQKALGYVLLATFGITGAVAIAAGGSSASPGHPATLAALVLGLGMTVSLTLGWAPYASDYTRYIPRTTPAWRVFVLAFVGLFASATLTQALGILTASRFRDTSALGVIHDILALTGPFGSVALAAFVLSAIASNTVADTTASYSLISAGVRLPRNVSAMLTAAIAFGLAVLAVAHYSTLYEDYLILLGYWTAPWVAILIVDWLACGIDGSERRGSWRRGATIFVAVAVATTALFSATAVYTGPIAHVLGGADIGYFVGFFAAGLLYYFTIPATRSVAIATPAEG